MARVLKVMLESLDKRLSDPDCDFLMGNALINDRIERRIVIAGAFRSCPTLSASRASVRRQQFFL
jgi:hypothetical protein